MSAPAPAGPLIRILVVDDHPVVRKGLTALLGTLPGMAVVGEAADGDEAVREAQLGRPDVVLMDISMPGVDGLEATRRIVRAVPQTAVLVLTMHADDDTVLAALQAGARGYLVKGAQQDQIESAVRAVVSGQMIFGPGVASRVLAYLTHPPDRTVPFPELTAREREVLDQIARGRSNSAIAAAFGVSGKTVSNHVSSIFAKLAVAGRAEAIVRARDGGLGRAGP